MFINLMKDLLTFGSDTCVYLLKPSTIREIRSSSQGDRVHSWSAFTLLPELSTASLRVDSGCFSPLLLHLG